MDDWQGCLTPRCQGALQQARTSVLGRGGMAITIEDFLLALLDSDPSVLPFLRSRGVDQDELVRTIQCEQPIISEVNGEGLLSSQLQYWFALSRELSDAPWLDWPELLGTLAGAAERLAGKAYVAVLEQVTHWPKEGACQVSEPSPGARANRHPIVVTESSFLQLAEDVAVIAAAQPRALLWLRGPRGCGKTAWLQTLAPSLSGGFLMLDLRGEAELSGLEAPVVRNRAPLLILDNTSPADLLTLMADETGIARHLLPGYSGPILMLSPHCRGSAVTRLEQQLGRPVTPLSMPRPEASQHFAILAAHQPDIERRWEVEISESALRYAGSVSGLAGLTPGDSLQWLSRAAARVAMLAERGPLEAQRLAGEVDTLQRQLLVAIARHRPTGVLEESLERLCIERAAAEVCWHERREEGNLRRVLIDDLKYERERWQLPGVQSDTCDDSLLAAL
ncbi:hypothetical protein [Marinobacter sp.]|uniref:hypothetical protein n=1 Tax=Marinobacter sp. TaxID=50741 RepID=UPI00384FF0E4